MRTQLLSEDTLTKEADRLVFAKDYEFSSPSAAASVIHGGHANGLIAWKNEKGVSLKVLEQKEMANNAIDSDEE
jgi:predicted type IV restriction endonuclease